MNYNLYLLGSDIVVDGGKVISFGSENKLIYHMINENSLSNLIILNIVKYLHFKRVKYLS
jgi:hypothetical protein